MIEAKGAEALAISTNEGGRDSDKRYVYDHAHEEVGNERVILHSAPSNSRKILSSGLEQLSSTSLIQINRRTKLQINKNSLSFTRCCNFSSTHRRPRECSRRFCHGQTTKLLAESGSKDRKSTIRKRCPLSDSDHNDSKCDYNHHHGLARGRAASTVHYGHRRSLAGSRSSPVTLLALLALSCVLLPWLVNGALSSQNSGDETSIATELTDDDLYLPTTTALSQQQQPQIPFSAIHNATNKSNNTKGVQSIEKQARAVTAKRAARLGPGQMGESDLLAFSEFIIQPPAFSDLMKSWPPTTLRAAASSLASAADSPTNRQRQQQQQLQLQNRPTTAPMVSLGPNPKKHQQRDQGGQQDIRSLLMRNHLNEDLDDTIVTADQSFEREQTPEPDTWINYLGDLGDYIYLQLKQYLEKAATTSLSTKLASGTNKSFNNKEDSGDPAAASASSTGQQQQRRSPLKMETIDELLDDYYYDQYENSQVLYYGAQLVHERETFEIGCFLPIDQQAEWTKSGRPLAPDGQSSPRTITRSPFLNAKQNFTLKVFTASLSDSGNYRCSKMSRKFHKLIVVPEGASPNQVYAIQQRLLSVVSPDKQSSSNAKFYQFKRTLRGSLAAIRLQSNQLVPGYTIVENEPLVVNCNITDIFVLQRLKDNPQFRLAWYKNGKQLPGSRSSPASTQTGVVMSNSASNHHSQRGAGSGTSGARQVAPMTAAAATTMAHQPRIQFLDSNGRKLFIGSAQYSDAGEYLCSWSNLPARQMSAPDLSDEENSELLATNGNTNNNQLVASNDQLEALSRNPLAAGSLSQLIVPVKLRPFKSTYHVRRGDQLRLVCQLQRGYPQAQLNWYAGNRLVDAEFLKEQAGRYKVLYLQNQSQFSALVSPNSSPSERPVAAEAGGSNIDSRPKIVEINPIPIGKVQMQLTQDGKWVEYRELSDEKALIDTSEQQLRYMQQKFARLIGINVSGSNLNQQQSRAIDADTLATLGQMSISVLVIESLDIERDTMRYACRATNRANTDEVTTVIRVQASSTLTVRPSTGRATLIPGQNLNFQCESSLSADAQFWWFRRKVNEIDDRLIEPTDDDHIQIHNNRLSLMNPTIDLIGDYYCRQIFINDMNKPQVNYSETALIRVRTQPVIADFGIETSHTGKSGTVRDGDRLELTCSVYDKMTPVNITWLRSMTSDDETSMVPLREGDLEYTTTTEVPRRRAWNSYDEEFTIYYPTHYVGKNQHGIEIQSVGLYTKKLIIESVSQEHRSYYACVADNGITERTKRIVFIRVKDKLIALWPFLGILAEFFILFTIIKIWETQRFNYTYGATGSAAPGARPLMAGAAR